MHTVFIMVKGEFFLVQKNIHRGPSLPDAPSGTPGLGVCAKPIPMGETGVSDVVAYVAGRVWVPQFGQWGVGMIYSPSHNTFEMTTLLWLLMMSGMSLGPVSILFEASLWFSSSSW